MDSASPCCPTCSAAHDHSDQFCRFCRSPLNTPMERNPLLHGQRQELPEARPSIRRRLFVGLVLGGLGLAGVGSCVGPALLRGLLSTAPLPVDKHRVLNFPLEMSLRDYTWLPDNKHILVFDVSTLFLLDVKSGKKIWSQPSSFPPSPEMMLLWSSDRRYVAEVGKSNSSGSHDQFQAVVWDLPLRQRIWTSPSLGHLGNTSYPCALAPSGAAFALCQDINDPVDYDSSKNTTVQIWDIQHNRLIKDWNVQGSSPVPGQAGDFAITTLAWSPDNTHLAVICTSGSVQVWDVTEGSCLWTYHISNGRGASLQWSPDGTFLALYLSGGVTSPIEMLDAHTGKHLFQTSGRNFSRSDVNGATVHGNLQESSSLCWSRDGTRLAMLVYENGTSVAQVCDAHTGQHLFTCQHVEGLLTGCSWSPDGRYLASGISAGGSSRDETLGEGSTIQFWDAQSGKALFSYQAPRAPSQLIWSADSRFLAIYNPLDFGHVGIHVEFLNFALQVFQVGNLG